MGMLQTSFRNADGIRRFNVPHTTILWLKHRLQEIGTTWNHPPRSGLPSRATPSKDWHIRLKHLWDQRRPSTRTAAETPKCHKAQVFKQTMRTNLRRFTQRARRPYRGPILNRQWRAAQCQGLRSNAVPSSICLTQVFPSSNAVQTLLCPAYSPSGTSSGTSRTMVQLYLAGSPIGLEWHPPARIIHLSPFLSRRCRIVHGAHNLVLTLLHLTVCCTDQNATINFCLTMDDSREVDELNHTKQFLV